MFLNCSLLPDSTCGKIVEQIVEQIVGQKLRTKNKLTPLALKKLKVLGRYIDGNNLYLKIEDTGSRRWILRLSINGKRRDMVLGSLSFVNLSDAGDLAYQYNKLAKSGIDPIQERLKEKGLLITSQEFVYKFIN